MENSEVEMMAPDWVPDEQVMECSGCLRQFTLTIRRHHCRACGNIFCGVCSSQECLLPAAFGFTSGPKRVCDPCAKQYFPYEALTAITPKGGKIGFGRLGSGPEIILAFHGTPGCYSQGLGLFDFFFDHQDLEKYTVIAPSRPGYGETPLEMGTSPKEAAEMCIQLLDEVGISRSTKLIVIGISGGGPTAIEFALSFPHRTTSLLLISCITRKYWIGQAKGLRENDTENQTFLSKMMMTSPTLQKASIWFLKKLSCSYPAGTERALRSALEEGSLWEEEERNKHIERILQSPEKVHAFQSIIQSLSTSTEGLVNDIRAFKELRDFELEDMKVPVLIIHGRNDGDVSLTHAEIAASRIPGCKLVTLPETDHLIFISAHLASTKREISSFLLEHSSTSPTEEEEEGEEDKNTNQELLTVLDLEQICTSVPNSNRADALSRLETENDACYFET